MTDTQTPPREPGAALPAAGRSRRWKVYVKDGIITWETQETDYTSVGPDRPEYEPQGCPRGAAFSRYTCSPTRVRYPQVRGKGGLVRASWAEAVEIVAAAQVHTIGTHGPDRVAGFSPIPAMPIAPHAAGARYHSLTGAPMLSFYDWYAGLPVASPQVFGDQPGVPEPGDWWDAAYPMMWDSNVPVTRTPDAHRMAEARYRGQKVVPVRHLDRCRRRRPAPGGDSRFRAPRGLRPRLRRGARHGRRRPVRPDSGRRSLPLVSVETLHSLSRRQTSDDPADAKEV
ncbi:hypothetical protein M878_07815 [Streptomyces roseochromogenus subsp. oscitans DS 12.976]|uniref:4Fe-4S Mo/W bis-MGD-type domain-containing protein n=1 Tax=Streptomyces roseochromogenus subsp. oscitans DS 12.976 TaxID=1352936 RepID=V6KSX9_STRRC|nr:hypothetical protein M878_07815 [Streptomyces roseochromogenus subsp. oscitans DS 12.976]